MSAKTEAPPAAPPADGADAPAKKSSMMANLIPILAVVVLAPVGSWAVAQFVIIPQLRKELTSAVAPKEGGDAHGDAHVDAAPEKGGHGKEEKKEAGGHGKKGEGAGSPGNSYSFENVVVNLSGTMGTRYLKSTFMVSGKDATLRSQFEANKPKLLDVTLNVLSALTLTDLEEPGSKNIIREKLTAAFNQALGKKVAEQVYFSDFVVQ